MVSYGCQSMVNRVKRVLLKHPRDAFQSQNKCDTESRALSYSKSPNFNLAVAQYDSFVKLIESFGSDTYYLPDNKNTTLDSIYTHDPCTMVNDGLIVCNMGKLDRSTETRYAEKFFHSIDIPVLGKIEGPGTLEGGDVVWINEQTVAIGEGYRSNEEGIRQFKKILGNRAKKIISVALPHWNGPRDCLHLMSNLSPIDDNLFIVYPKLLPVPFIKYLIESNIKLIEVPDKEYYSMGCNVLAMAKRRVIMLEGNPITKKKLEAEGVVVKTYNGSEISLKGAGGPTCLTRPFLRLTN
tara:strand:- start:1387 stop:2271 length:885 start_codon:yes stop_codon:yes gene_type:complete